MIVSPHLHKLMLWGSTSLVQQSTCWSLCQVDVKEKLTSLVRNGPAQSFGANRVDAVVCFFTCILIFFWSFHYLPQWILPCRTYTMHKFITHEAISAKLFNMSHSSASGTLLPWQNVLTNSAQSLALLVKRLEMDFQGMPVKGRKAWGVKDVDPW